jgi:hypothetical protein
MRRPFQVFSTFSPRGYEMSEKNIPTVAPTADIVLFGEQHTIKYTFRSYHELGINPFDMESIEAYNAKAKGLAELAETVRAGLLHEYYGRRASRKGEEPPTVDELMDELDPIAYVDIWAAVNKTMGVDKEEKSEAKEPADPPSA